jgi:hypothetical protein
LPKSQRRGRQASRVWKTRQNGVQFRQYRFTRIPALDKQMTIVLHRKMAIA